MSILENYKPGNYFFLMPWIGVISWWGMLMALLICWGVQGRPIYSWMQSAEYVHGSGLVYISDIGATNLQPLFIALAGMQGLFYVITLALEYFQRCGRWPFMKHSFVKRHKVSTKESAQQPPKTESQSQVSSSSSSSTLSNTDNAGSATTATHHGDDLQVQAEYLDQQYKQTDYPFYMPFWFSEDERNLMFASFVSACIGEVCILICSIFNTRRHHRVHITMVSLFLLFLAISVILSGTEYILMGMHYRAIHPQHKKNNKYFVSGIWKEVWVCFAILWAILFGAISQNSLSAVFEWLVAFWYGLIFITFSVDFYLGGRYKYSKHFPYVESFQGYYKYDRFYAKYGNDSGDL
ncbi:hypothetical protein ACO0RG_001952 [Hanseniaspora osmophila]